jgi:hypothetical protein
MKRSAIGARTLALATFIAASSATISNAQETEPEKYLTWNDLLSTDSTLKFYGYIRLDAQYNDSRFNDPQIPGFVRSEDTSGVGGVPAGVIAESNDDEYALHPRLTRFGVDLTGPTIAGLGDPKLGGKVEIDFYNIGLPDSDSRQAFRMRRGFLTLKWERWTLLAGQEWDLVSPLFPAVNSDLMMWGAGNTGDRRPQLRAQYDAPLSGGTFTTTFGIGLGGSVSENTVLGGLRSGENSGRPMVAARVGYKTADGITFGVWGHDDEEDYDPDGAGALTEQAFDSNSVGVDLMLPFNSGDTWLKGEYWRGENVDDIRGGIFQGVNTAGMGIDAAGGWAELGHKLTSKATISAGYSFDDPEDGDLDNFARAQNDIAYATVVWNYGSRRFGLEYLNWETDYVGLSSGDANRYVAWIAYYF